jgi:hypothetical protein
MNRRRSFILLGLLCACSAGMDSARAAEPDPARVEVFYFHRTLRCPTCLTMETFTAEAAEHFSAEKNTGRLRFRAINLDDEGPRHFAQDYGLEFSSVVLSRWTNGQEAAWTNLPSAWSVVGDRSNFIAYVEMEISKQLGQLPKE